MLELTTDREYQIPEYVDLATAIPNYNDMSPIDKDHYKRMYTAVCNSELYNDMNYIDANNIKALTYFIFYHNLAYLPSGEKIFPLLKFFWSQQTGFRLEVQTDRSSELLPALSLLTSMPQAYFAALMLSLALFQRFDAKTSEYQECFKLLESLLNGQYSDAFRKIEPSFVSQSDYGWFFRYLPRPEKFDFSTILNHHEVENVRITLIGGIFPRPAETAVVKPKWRCLIM